MLILRDLQGRIKVEGKDTVCLLVSMIWIWHHKTQVKGSNHASEVLDNIT